VHGTVKRKGTRNKKVKYIKGYDVRGESKYGGREIITQLPHPPLPQK
jgi:hypothetical protein